VRKKKKKKKKRKKKKEGNSLQHKSASLAVHY